MCMYVRCIACETPLPIKPPIQPPNGCEECEDNSILENSQRNVENLSQQNQIGLILL